MKRKEREKLAAISAGVRDKVVILCREARLRMLVFSLLCLAIASASWSGVFVSVNGEESMFGDEDQSRVIELGIETEENLNCFLQFDRSLADKWTSKLGLVSNVNEDQAPVLISRLKDDEEIIGQRLAADTRIMLKNLGYCMGNLTKDLKNPGLLKCMKGLVSSEIEKDGFISAPELFDNTLPLPFLSFLDIRELAKLLFQNRTWEKLSHDEMMVFRTSSDYLMKDNSGRDKVFLIDQACEWKNFQALKKKEEDLDDQLKEFKQQVIRSISLQVGQAVFHSGDIKPGTWITVYRRWAPVRLQNLKELQTMVNDLVNQKFTTEELCRYATVLAKYFAEEELKILLPARASPLHLVTKDIKEKSFAKEEGLCARGASNECASFREMRKSYEDDLSCVESFGKLLSNHILNSIVGKYDNIEPRITYPEIVCKRSAPLQKIAVRYCRCVGSFCISRDVGEIKANSYKLIDSTLVTTRV